MPANPYTPAGNPYSMGTPSRDPNVTNPEDLQYGLADDMGDGQVAPPSTQQRVQPNGAPAPGSSVNQPHGVGSAMATIGVRCMTCDRRGPVRLTTLAKMGVDGKVLTCKCGSTDLDVDDEPLSAPTRRRTAGWEKDDLLSGFDGKEHWRGTIDGFPVSVHPWNGGREQGREFNWAVGDKGQGSDRAGGFASTVEDAKAAAEIAVRSLARQASIRAVAVDDEDDDIDPRWEKGKDVKVRGGLARPYQGSNRIVGYWLAVRPDGSVVTDSFGRKYFATPGDVEQFLASEGKTGMRMGRRRTAANGGETWPPSGPGFYLKFADGSWIGPFSSEMELAEWEKKSTTDEQGEVVEYKGDKTSARRRTAAASKRLEYNIDRPGLPFPTETVANIIAVDLAKADPGEVEVVVNGRVFSVYYSEDTATGDDGRPVRGDVTGDYSVSYKRGSEDKYLTSVHVSPHGTSGYGNSGARSYAAREVAMAICSKVAQTWEASRRTADAGIERIKAETDPAVLRQMLKDNANLRGQGVEFDVLDRLDAQDAAARERLQAIGRRRTAVVSYEGHDITVDEQHDGWRATIRGEGGYYDRVWSTTSAADAENRAKERIDFNSASDAAGSFGAQPTASRRTAGWSEYTNTVGVPPSQRQEFEYTEGRYVGRVAPFQVNPGETIGWSWSVSENGRTMWSGQQQTKEQAQAQVERTMVGAPDPENDAWLRAAIEEAQGRTAHRQSRRKIDRVVAAIRRTNRGLPLREAQRIAQRTLAKVRQHTALAEDDEDPLDPNAGWPGADEDGYEDGYLWGLAGNTEMNGSGQNAAYDRAAQQGIADANAGRPPRIRTPRIEERLGRRRGHRR